MEAKINIAHFISYGNTLCKTVGYVLSPDGVVVVSIWAGRTRGMTSRCLETT